MSDSKNNSGYCNSGNYNSGNFNSGHGNSGQYNSGHFNTNEPTVRLFNKETNLKRSEINIPYINLKITEWISEDKMTDEQKKNDKDYRTNKGTLIKRSYKEAWKLYWSEIDEKTKQRFLNLPNFDAVIFEEITGIDVNLLKKETCEGKTVLIDGIEYILKLK